MTKPIFVELHQGERNRINVLISLHRGYGLGDAVQMSAVLRHVAKYRSHWNVDYLAEKGKHVVGRGIVNNILSYDKPLPYKNYDAAVEIRLYDTWANWHDRPNTRVSSCLHECFDLEWDPKCGRYQIEVRQESMWAASTLIHRWQRTGNVETKHHTRHYTWSDSKRDTRCVAVHYQGDSSPERKNLSHSQANVICEHIARLGHTPVILDWRKKSPLEFFKVRTPDAWGKDAEMVCAVISQCIAFVGIDSGPSKCAAATDTPSLVIWTGHHPAPFHDPAPNTTHLVPLGYHSLEPVCSDPGVIQWFEANHNVLQYKRDPVVETCQWLSEVLR